MNTNGWGYGADQTLTTATILNYSYPAGGETAIPPTVPTITTQAATNVATSTVTLNGTLTAEGGASSTISGFDYGLTDAYGTEATSTYNAGVGTFLENITSLTPNTTYHFRAKAKNSAGWGYGSDTTLTTISTSTLTTNAATDLAATTATLNGTLTDEGHSSSTIVGFQYGLTDSYGSEATSTYSGGTGAFSKGITGLTASTLYHFKAEAKNSAGWGYGSDATLTTNAPPAPQTGYVDPSSDVSVTWTSGAPADPTTHYTRVDDGIRQPNACDEANWNGVASNTGGIDTFGMTNIEGIATATNITIWVNGTLVAGTVPIYGYTNLTGATTKTAFGFAAFTKAWKSVSFNGTWTQADIDSLQVSVEMGNTGGSVSMTAYGVYAVITYTQ
ncbi:MAG: hypothetical protein WC297_00850 [Candidatus Paceibacterota bacterium]|jgi:hypothetical protein